MDWWKRTFVREPFSHGVSWGCGTGEFERSLMSKGIVRRLDAMDISKESVEKARDLTREAGIAGIDFRLGNFDEPEIPWRKYDIVFFHAALHHVGALERLFRRIALNLASGTAVYVDNEFVGPSRGEWKDRDIELARALYALVPPDARQHEKIEFPIQPDDPSEAIRSSEIGRFLRDFFDISAWRPFGGQLASILCGYASREWLATEDGERFLRTVLAIEDWQLARDPSSTYSLFACGRLKPIRRLAPPLARQAGRALARRARRLRPAPPERR